MCAAVLQRPGSFSNSPPASYFFDESEVAAGFVLTCQSYPLSDDVTVDFDA